MIVSINQPAYLPWLGYFERIACSDEHIVLDHVQFEKNSFTNRNRVRVGREAGWLTVPVQTAGRFGRLPINEVQIDNTVNWRAKHWRTLQQSYGKAPYFGEHADFFEDVYGRKWERLAELCDIITAHLLDAFQIRTIRRYSAGMSVSGAKSDLIVNLCTHLGADTYLSGALGRDYLEPEAFAKAGMKIVYQDFRHPVYLQRGGPFISHLAAIDLLFNCGPGSREILLGVGKESTP